MTSLRFLQPKNALSSISFIELGIVTFVVFLSKYANIFLLFLSIRKLSLISKFLLFELIEICEIFEKLNAKLPISFTESGIVIDSIFVFKNALTPIFSRPSFKITSSRFLQPKNALSPISFIEPVIETELIKLLEKAPLPISVIFLPWYSLGIVTLESFPINFVIFQVFDLVSSNLKFFLKFNKSSSLVGFSGFGLGLSSGLTSGVVPGLSSGLTSGVVPGLSSGLTSGVVPGFLSSGLGFGLFSSGFKSSLFSFEFCFTLWSQEIVANGSIVVNAEILLNISHILLFFYFSFSYLSLLFIILFLYILKVKPLNKKKTDF